MSASAGEVQGEPINQNGVMAKILDEQPEKTVGGSFQGAFATEELFLLTPQLTFKDGTPCISLIGEDITNLRLDGYAINWASEHL